MSSSDEDDDSSYESTEERIGGMLHEAVLEVNEEIAIAQSPVIHTRQQFNTSEPSTLKTDLKGRKVKVNCL